MWKVNFGKTPRGKYRVYSPTALTSAYLKIKDSSASIRKTAREYGVPEATLRDRLSLRVDLDVTRSGTGPLFSQEQESTLASHLEFMSSVGYGYSRAEVIDMATEFAVCCGYRSREEPLSVQWYRGFMGRWPQLKIIKPRGLQMQRAKSTSAECIGNYFDELESILTKYDLLSSPERIYNVDEKGLSTMHKPPTVVAAVDTKPPAVTSGGHVNVTVIGCGNALGHQIPPYLIFPGARMRSELLDGRTPGADGTTTDSGWSNSEVFQKYLDQHLIKYLPERSKEKPVLLLYDGHRSHISINLINWAKNQNIILFVLPAQTSHVLQPMDVGCFGPYERIYNALAHKFMRLNCGVSITRTNICALACKAYTAALSPENLQSSFRKSGIYPFDRTVVNPSSFLPSTALESADTDQCDGISQQARFDTGPEQDFFAEREHNIRKKKIQTLKRRNISTIVSGKAITEAVTINKIIEYNEASSAKKTRNISTSKEETGIEVIQCREKSHVKKPRKLEKHVRKENTKMKTTTEPQPGPSHYYVDASLDYDSDTSSVSEDDKCCVCHQFTPKEVRDSLCIKFTKWAKCDDCEHWVHLIYCTDKRVIRRGDTFLCPHCLEE